MGGVPTWKCFSALFFRTRKPIPPNGEGNGKSSTQTCRLSGDMLVLRRAIVCWMGGFCETSVETTVSKM